MKSLWKHHRHQNIVHCVHVLNPDSKRLIVFFPGWLSTEATWRYVLPELSKNFRVEYFESREKPSSLPNRIRCQTFQAHGDDAVSFLNSLGDTPYYVVSASIGASVYLSIVDRLEKKPDGQILISPGARSPADKVSGPLAILFAVLRRSPSWHLYFLRPIFLAIIKHLAAEKDEYQATAAIQSFATANLVRVTASARQLLKFELDLNAISKVAVPMLIIAARHDSAHNIQDVKSIDNCLPNSSLYFFDTFTHTYSSICARKILDWIDEVTLKEQAF
ncbi:MAG: alpha/beta hydrolase [Cyanobacteria bacterium J06627_32]